jgi:hypothetical protein
MMTEMGDTTSSSAMSRNVKGSGSTPPEVVELRNLRLKLVFRSCRAGTVSRRHAARNTMPVRSIVAIAVVQLAVAFLVVLLRVEERSEAMPPDV